MDMKTSVNVMGIQAKSILERIAVTLKAVLRTGKENKTVKLIGNQSEQAEASVFTASDPVFYEERLKEMPEPNWTSAQVVHPKLLIEQGSRNQSSDKPPQFTRSRKMRPIRKRTVESRLAYVNLSSNSQEGRTQANEIRDFRSSPSPPLGTAT
jgi:hypothetical protein